MSQKPSVSLVEISFFVHATEDPSRALEAVQRMIPKPYLNVIDFRRRNLKGHHGNPIIHFLSKTRDEETAKLLIENIASELEPDDKLHLLSQITSHIDNRGNLYLRLDKQSAYLGEAKIGHSDPIRIRIKLKLPSKSFDKIVDAYRSLNLIPQ